MTSNNHYRHTNNNGTNGNGSSSQQRRSKEMYNVINDVEGQQPLLEILDSRSCCPACCQRICCGACIRFCSPWRTCILITLAIIGLCATGFVLQKLGIIWADPKHIPPPSLPGGPYLRNATTMSLSISWSPADTHGVALSRYLLAYRTLQQSTIQWTEINVGNSLAMDITALSPLTKYAVRVIAYTSSASSNWTDASIFMTLNGSLPSIPGQPVLRSAAGLGMELAWQPSTENGVPVQSYQLQMHDVGNLTSMDDPDTSSSTSNSDGSNDDDSDEKWYDVYNGLSTSYSVNPLAPQFVYEFRLRAIAVNNEGNTSWSVISKFHTDANDATVPHNSTLHVSSVNSHSATVWWDRPYDGGSEITKYTIEHDSGGGTPFGHQTTVYLAPPFDRIVQNIDQLSSSTTYRFHYRATNHMGDGEWSDTIILHTSSLAPPDPPSSLTVTAVDEKSQTVQWKAGKSYGADILGYQLEHDDWWTDTPFKPFPETLELTQVVTGLLPAVTYHYRIRERNRAGWSSYTNLTASTLTYGSCGNQADMHQFKAKRDVFSATVKSCMTQCIPYKPEMKCVRGCVVKNLGMSDDCGECYEEESTCVKTYCVVQCIFGKPLFDCTKCVQEFCYPSLVRCTGIPASVLPP